MLQNYMALCVHKY